MLVIRHLDIASTFRVRILKVIIPSDRTDRSQDGSKILRWWKLEDERGQKVHGRDHRLPGQGTSGSKHWQVNLYIVLYFNKSTHFI